MIQEELTMIAFSPQEEFLSNFVGKIRCLTMSQANTIMHKYFSCSKGQTYVMLKELASRQHITISSDQKYIMAGGSKSSQTEKLDKASIACLYYAIDQIDNIEDLEMMYKPSNGATFSYVHNEDLYQLMYLTADTLSKIYLLQNQYIDIKKDIEKKDIKNAFYFTTVFVFEATENENEILEKLERMNIVMPHILVFMKTKDLSETPQYESYSISQ